MAGINYSLDTGTALSFETRYRNYKDRLPEPDFDECSLTFKGMVNQSFKNFFFNISAEQGMYRDRLKNKDRLGEIFEGSCYFTPARNQSYGADIRYATAINENDTLKMGISGTFNLAEKVRIMLKLDRQDNIGGDEADQNTFELGLNYLLPYGIIISAQGRHIFYSNDAFQQDETYFALNFSVPWGMPVGRKTSVGTVSGKVRDRESGRVLEDAILNLNGATAVTDDDGNFLFPSIKPGLFYLNINRASIGLDHIPADKMPMGVAVHGGSDTKLDILVTKKSQLTGRITLGEAGDTPVLVDDPELKSARHVNSLRTSTQDKKTGIGQVLLELDSKLEILRGVTDRKGRFYFNDIRPGSWKLKIHAENLPESYYFKQTTLEVKLLPGEKKEMHIHAIQRPRTIHIIEHGGTVSEESL